MIFHQADIVQLVAEKIDDSRTYCRMSQVNKLCHKICNRTLVRKKKSGRHWTELPGVPGVFHGAVTRYASDDPNTLIYSHQYLNGVPHGVHKGLYRNKCCGYIRRYMNGKEIVPKPRYSQSAWGPWNILIFPTMFIFLELGQLTYRALLIMSGVGALHYDN